MYKAMIPLALLATGLSEAALADPAPVADAKPRKICRRSELTGTRMGSRVICHTADEWKHLDDTTQRMMEDLGDLRLRGGQNAFEQTSKPF